MHKVGSCFCAGSMVIALHTHVLPFSPSGSNSLCLAGEILADSTLHLFLCFCLGISPLCPLSLKNSIRGFFLCSNQNSAMVKQCRDAESLLGLCLSVRLIFSPAFLHAVHSQGHSNMQGLSSVSCTYWRTQTQYCVFCN